MLNPFTLRIFFASLPHGKEQRHGITKSGKTPQLKAVILSMEKDFGLAGMSEHERLPQCHV